MFNRRLFDGFRSLGCLQWIFWRTCLGDWNHHFTICAVVYVRAPMHPVKIIYISLCNTRLAPLHYIDINISCAIYQWYMIWYDMTRYDALWRYLNIIYICIYIYIYMHVQILRCDMRWCDVKWHDMLWHHITSHHTMIWYDMIWHDMAWYDMTWQDIT